MLHKWFILMQVFRVPEINIPVSTTQINGKRSCKQLFPPSINSWTGKELCFKLVRRNLQAASLASISMSDSQLTHSRLNDSNSKPCFIIFLTLNSVQETSFVMICLAACSKIPLSSHNVVMLLEGQYVASKTLPVLKNLFYKNAGCRGLKQANN